MHIEAGVVDATKIGLSYITAFGAIGMSAKLAYDNIKKNNIISFVIKAILSTIAVFVFFEVFPHQAVGVSEVHLILGSTLFLLFGVGVASVGLAMGLLIQGLFFAPFDLPQYGMNVTTLLVPLMGLSYLAKGLSNKAYTELAYKDVLKLSLAYQGGIIAWVAFWAIYGQGFSTQNIVSVGSFGMAYILVVLIEPLIDLAVLALAKSFKQISSNIYFFEKRLTN
jgi:ABC-type Co2+ transport system permease subunit